MKDDKLKFYLEILKTLTAIIIGTGAGVYGLITQENKDKINYDLLLIFIICFCSMAVILYVLLVVYVELKLRNNERS